MNFSNEIRKQISLSVNQTQAAIISNKKADLVFLESVIRSVEKTTASSSHQYLPEKLVNLGLLFSGMGWWDTPSKDWNALSQCADLEIIDVVVRGMTAVMNINSERLLFEANYMLESTQKFLSSSSDSLESNVDADQISDFHVLQVGNSQFSCQHENSSDELFRKIEKLPAFPRWEIAADLQLSPNVLVQALQYPARGIWQSAFLLIKHGAGGKKAIDLAKQLMNDEDWSYLERTLSESSSA